MLLITDLMSHFCSHLHRTGAVRFKADSLITKFQNLGTAEGVSTYYILDFWFSFFFIFFVCLFFGLLSVFVVVVFCF